MHEAAKWGHVQVKSLRLVWRRCSCQLQLQQLALLLLLPLGTDNAAAAAAATAAAAAAAAAAIPPLLLLLPTTRLRAAFQLARACMCQAGYATATRQVAQLK